MRYILHVLLALCSFVLGEKKNAMVVGMRAQRKRVKMGTGFQVSSEGNSGSGGRRAARDRLKRRLLKQMVCRGITVRFCWWGSW